MQSEKTFDDSRYRETPLATDHQNMSSSNGNFLLNNCSGNFTNGIGSNCYYSWSQENGRSTRDEIATHAKTSTMNERLKCLRHILADFHHHVDVELPFLLQRIKASEKRMEELPQGQSEISRECFQLRQCFQSMKEILLRDDLLDLLDGGDANGNEPGTVGPDLTSTNLNNAPYDFENSDLSNSVLPLREIFVNDLVQLSSVSFFDTVSNEEYFPEIFDSGVIEVHHSLVVLATNRYPVKATLEDDHIFLLLARVVSLIQNETHSVHEASKMKQHHRYYYEKSVHLQQDQYQQTRNDFEPLQSLLSWLNREMTADRLSQGGIIDCAEVIVAMQISLELLSESKESFKGIFFSTGHLHSILTPEIVLSLRILIDVLLEALDLLVLAGNNDCNNDGNLTNGTNGIDGGMVSSLRKWLSMPKEYQKPGELQSSGTNFEGNSHLHLLRQLDRYTMDLVEESMTLLRPQKRKPPLFRQYSEQNNGDYIHSIKQGVAVGQKRHRSCYEIINQGDSNSDGHNKSIKLMTQSRHRVVNVLQHADMVANALSIMETGHTMDTDSASLVFAAPSRSFWRAFARFIIEEVNCLEDNEDSDIYCLENEKVPKTENYVESSEKCRLAATDILFRLTKKNVQSIIFHDRSKKYSNVEQNIKSVKNMSTACNKAVDSPNPQLSNEEFSVLLITILRLLAHPCEYWTEGNQAWVASLLYPNDPKSAGDSLDVHIASKLRRALHATLMSSSYVPDNLSFEEQCFVNSSLKSLLFPAPINTEFNAGRNNIDNSSPESKSSKGVPRSDVLQNDLWESFWATRQ